jgi:hypothetical protein
VQDGGGVDAVAEQHEGQRRGEAAALGEALPREEGREGREAAEQRREEEGRRVGGLGHVLEGEDDQDRGGDAGWGLVGGEREGEREGEGRGGAYRRMAPTKSTSFQARRSREGRYFWSGQERRKVKRETPPMGPLVGGYG